MVDITWFFSTLAQATAASVGFIVAISAAIYSIRKEKQRQEIASYRQDIRDLEDQLFPIIRETIRDFAFILDIETNASDISEYRVENPDETRNNLEKWSEEEQYSKGACLWGILIWISKILSDIRSEKDYQELQDYHKELKYAVGEAQRYFELEDDLSDKILGDICSAQEDLDSSETDIWDSSLPYNKKVDRYIEENSPQNLQEMHSGNFAGRSLTFSEFNNRFIKIDDRNTIFNGRYVGTPLEPILYRIKILFFSGVLLPMVFLTVEPKFIKSIQIPNIGILGVEIGFLIFVGYHTLSLFDEVEDLLE